MERKTISRAVIKRPPRYYRYLGDLLESGVERISSNELSDKMQVTASQIRQDLNNFGGFGQQGYGYNIKGLYKEINAILGLDREYKMVIVGTGNLGQALANYSKYHKSGFPIVGMFDINPKIIGLKINDIEVMDSDLLVDFLKENHVDIGIITTDKAAAQSVADKLVEGRVRGIWNFATIDLKVPKNIPVENVHVTDTLNALAYHIIHNEENAPGEDEA